MTEPLAPQLTEEQREQLLRNAAEVHAAIDRFARALIPQVQAAAKAFADLGRQLQDAGLIDADGKPTRTDRPAWQTPYRPPQRRH
ncbi:hypothetical protein GCM10010294_25230 [Streptomyces griseoloalbus]|uniref:hypothetical protein n=1 Tax=Streptomyces griseoloalbus TaxID=67303 RepID=UPI0018757854|nr:hypothetical protein GCM10010294_25230 [Streptomyces griseoloalbus]